MCVASTLWSNNFINKVYTKARRKSSKKKGIIFEKVSIRVAIREWRKENDKLFDVGLNMENVPGR